MGQNTLTSRALRRCKGVLPRGSSDAARRAKALVTGPRGRFGWNDALLARHQTRATEGPVQPRGEVCDVKATMPWGSARPDEVSVKAGRARIILTGIITATGGNSCNRIGAGGRLAPAPDRDRVTGPGLAVGPDRGAAARPRAYSAAWVRGWCVRSRVASSGRQAPHLVPAPSAVPRAWTDRHCPLAMAVSMVLTPTPRQAQTVAPGSGRSAVA